MAGITPGMDLFNLNLQQNLGSNALNSSLLNNPDQANLYLQQNFSTIFENFLTDTQADVTDFEGNSTSDNTDFFGNSSSTDPFSSDSGYYSELIKIQQQQYYSQTDQLAQLNSAANLIGKQANYALNGNRMTGTIEAVENDQGTIRFKIDGQLVAMTDVIEVLA